MAYNNREHGGRFPVNEEVFRALDVIAEPLAEGERKTPQPADNTPSCNWEPDKE